LEALAEDIASQTLEAGASDMPNLRVAEKPYHHGNLRKALIEAGLAVLEEVGHAGLTLRAVASRAGVSHAAPAHHFASAKGLLTVMATSAFARFEAALADGRAKTDPDPVSQIRVMGRVYLEFARAHPEQFRLMFTAAKLDWRDAELLAIARMTYRHLEEIARPAADAMGANSATARTNVEYLIWSVAHGFAHLAIEHQIPKPGAPVPTDVPDIGGLLFATAHRGQAGRVKRTKAATVTAGKRNLKPRKSKAERR